jgi:hypothetical protein
MNATSYAGTLKSWACWSLERKRSSSRNGSAPNIAPMDAWTQLAPEEGQLHNQMLALEAEIASSINALANAIEPLSKAQQVAAGNKLADAFKILRAHIHQLDLLADEQDT